MYLHVEPSHGRCLPSRTCEISPLNVLVTSLIHQICIRMFFMRFCTFQFQHGFVCVCLCVCLSMSEKSRCVFAFMCVCIYVCMQLYSYTAILMRVQDHCISLPPKVSSMLACYVHWCCMCVSVRYCFCQYACKVCVYVSVEASPVRRGRQILLNI